MGNEFRHQILGRAFKWDGLGEGSRFDGMRGIAAIRDRPQRSIRSHSWRNGATSSAPGGARLRIYADVGAGDREATVRTSGLFYHGETMPKERKTVVPSQELNIKEFLASEGYSTPWAQHQARAVLEAAGLTKPGRMAMLATKRTRAQEQLAKWLVRTCGSDECMAWAKEISDGRLVLAASELTCEVCGGSNNRRAAMALARVCATKGVTRLLIVGGVGATRGEVESLLGGTGVELRMIDGSSGRHTRGDAAPNLAWAQLLVIWGSSPLPHAVSNTYTVERPRDLKVITVSRRGVEALCREMIRAVKTL